MKIRIKGNSLRYRLSKTDVANFAAGGYLEECTNFGMQTLIYALQLSDKSDLSATFLENKITIFMPRRMANEWVNTDNIGYESDQDNFYILVEKDFQCLDNVSEDQSDNYANPLSVC
jgi:hypothetical protein